MLATIGVILLVAWLLGFLAFSVAGGLIHILLVIPSWRSSCTSFVAGARRSSNCGLIAGRGAWKSEHGSPGERFAQN